MEIFKNIRINFRLLSPEYSDSMTFNKLTLAFTGKLSRYEEEYLDDYFVNALNPFRFSLILAMIFYGAFALLDAITIPELKCILVYKVCSCISCSVIGFCFFIL